MVFFNAATKELTVKIVYYGPGLSGKTTNLQHIYNTLPDEDKGRMLSLATSDDRTLFFDFLPVELGEIKGMKTRVQLYTVPGQVYYNTTRKLVLKGCDGVVFVADSQEGLLNANLESMDNLRQNLFDQGDDLSKMPLVIQYNKRDLASILPIDELQKKINTENRLYLEAVATEGEGVLPTLKKAIKATLIYVSQEQGINVSMESAKPAPQKQTAPKAETEKKTTSPPEPIEKALKEKKSDGGPEQKKETEVKPESAPAIRSDEPRPATAGLVTKADESREDEEKVNRLLKMGYDSHIDDISLAAAAFKEQLDDGEPPQKTTPVNTITASPEKEKSQKAADVIPMTKVQAPASPSIADEIKVELSNKQVFVDVNGVRVPIRVSIPKSMANLNLRFDLRINIRDEETED